jgi:hypothetical protein
MTPKETAKELLDEMSSQTYSFQPYAGAHYLIEEIGWEAGKKCALIAVQQILEIIFSDYDWQYWNEVKKEIEKL